MLLDDVLKNPTLRRVLAAGEEQVGKAVGKLLSSATVTSGLQGLLQSALHARAAVDRGVQQALRAAQLPSREDMAQLRRKIEELESMIDGLSERVGRPPERRDDGQE